MGYQIVEHEGTYDTTLLRDLDGGSGHETDHEETPSDAPPTFGRCPVCDKPLFPRDRNTGAPKAPIPGTGYDSRAKCGRCGNTIVYLGNYEWRLLQPGDLTVEDHEFNRMSDFLGGGE